MSVIVVAIIRSQFISTGVSLFINASASLSFDTNVFPSADTDLY